MTKQGKPRPSNEPAVGHLAVNISGKPPELTFLFEQQQQRLSRAFGLSLLVHGAGFVLALFLASLTPVSRAIDFTERLNREIVWLAVPGPGGGGGGGGNESPEPPRKVELPGRDEIAVPVAPAPKPTPEIKEEPPPADQQLTIPAQALAAGKQMVPGVLEGVSGTSSQGSGEGGGGGSGTGTGMGPGRGSGLGPGEGGGVGGGAYRPGNGVLPPRVLREVKPAYTADAMRAKVQGSVLLQCIVLPDGSVSEVEIVRSLDPTFGLDQEAMKAARQWKFAPGTRFGQPVPVLVTIELTFNLR